MIIRSAIFFSLLVSLASCAVAQTKAIVLQNTWNNDLNNYNPKEYLDQLNEMLRMTLALKELDASPAGVTAEKKEPLGAKDVKEHIQVARAAVGNAYFIVLRNELRLPVFNLGKFLFKNPPRSSKLTFTLHVYDSAAIEVFGDTIINRGCLVKTIDESRGARYYYSDYSDFMSDMRCHLEYIRKVVQEKRRSQPATPAMLRKK